VHWEAEKKTAALGGRHSSMWWSGENRTFSIRL
jgi:hypothetical protein